MRIAIVGCGAMGSVYAGLLADAGHEVTAIDAWQEHVDAIRTAGLRVEGASGDRTVRLPATTDAAEVEPVELVVIATKVRDVRAAARSARPLIGPGTVVLSIQNGIGGPEAAAAELGEERVLIGVAGGFGAAIRAPGHVHHGGWQRVRIGERAGPVSARVERVAGAWQRAGFRVATCADVGQLVWDKLVMNAGFSGPCGVTGLTIGEALQDPDAWPVSRACAEEAAAVARAHGVVLGFDDVDAELRRFAAGIAGERPSLLLDLLAGRRSEIDAINGAVAERGTALGVATPANTLVSRLVRARERSLGCV